MGGQDVDGVLVEPGAEGLDQEPQPVAVALGVLERLGVHQVGGPHDAPLGDERQHGDPHGGAVAGREVEHPAVVGSGRFGHQVHVAQPEQGGDGPQAAGVVVVAGDDGDRRAGARQGEERPVDDLLGLRRRRRRVEQVAGDDDHVDRFGVGDRRRSRPARRGARRPATRRGWPCRRASPTCAAASPAAWSRHDDHRGDGSEAGYGRRRADGRRVRRCARRRPRRRPRAPGDAGRAAGDGAELSTRPASGRRWVSCRRTGWMRRPSWPSWQPRSAPASWPAAEVATSGSSRAGRCRRRWPPTG